MKYLLYYKLDSNFIADQTSVGGDGTKVVSVVDGVAWTNDQEKTYYRLANNDSENLTSYTVTVHYKTRFFDETIAPDDVIVVDAYVGKSVKETVVAKTISGYTALSGGVEFILSDNIEYTFYYDGELKPEEEPLTFRIISGGTICWKNYDSNSPSYTKTILYSLNGSELVSITSSSEGTSFNVNDGDIVRIKGNNSTYTEDPYHYNTFSGSTAKFEVEGNIMSLLNSENFANISALTNAYAFYRLFKSCTGLTTAEKLLLPASVLTSACYAYLFWECSNLLYGPKLPATQLVSQCYRSMFRSCTNLKIAPELESAYLAAECYRELFYDCKNLDYIKCLATDISSSRCTYTWVEGVSSTGTFVKDPNMSSWTTGVNGIPTNWTVQDNV